MRITAIDTYIAGNPWKNWLFAKVSTDEGIHGVGEGTLNYFGKTIEAAIHELKPLIIGMDPFQVEIISQPLIPDASPPPPPTHTRPAPPLHTPPSSSLA